MPFCTLGLPGLTEFSWDSKAREELVFWLGNVDCFNGQSIWRSPSAVRVVYSDASSTGFGSYIVEHGSHIVHGQWTL